MEFLQRSRHAAGGTAVGLLPGAFNPPTQAHLALARAALARVAEVVFVLPRAFPHKAYEGAGFEARVEMLRAAVAKEPDLSIAVANSGLFRAIAREWRELCGPEARLAFLCGRDAAERMLNWDYGGETSVGEMLREFDLLVAARRGELDAPLHARHAIHQLYLSEELDDVSSSEVRQRIARGEAWEHLVPEGVRELAGRIYGARQI